jgi:gas vesicle protein
MNKNNKIKLVEGGLIGVALGVAAGIALAPKSGKEFRGDIKKKSAEFYTYLAPQLKKIKVIGEKEYDSFLHDAMATYVKVKLFSEKEGADLLTHIKKQGSLLKTTYNNNLDKIYYE